MLVSRDLDWVVVGGWVLDAVCRLRVQRLEIFGCIFDGVGGSQVVWDPRSCDRVRCRLARVCALPMLRPICGGEKQATSGAGLPSAEVPRYSLDGRLGPLPAVTTYIPT